MYKRQGVYYFSSLESVNIYLESELWKGVVAHPNLVNFKTDIFRTFKGTELANGSHSMRKKSSESSDAENLQILVVNYTNEVNPSDEEMSKQVLEYAPVFGKEILQEMMGNSWIIGFVGNLMGWVFFFTPLAKRSELARWPTKAPWGFVGVNGI